MSLNFTTKYRAESEILLSQSTINQKKVRSLLAELSLRDAFLEINERHVSDVILQNLRTKMTSDEAEMTEVVQRKEKIDASINRLKDLSYELNKKVEYSMNTIQLIQQEEHKNREDLTESFSLKVKDISGRVHDLDARKNAVNEENVSLKNELTRCISLATADQASFDLPLDISSYHFDADDERNALEGEHHAMIFEDYRSKSVSLTSEDEALQQQLTIFVDQFQALSSGLMKNNAELQEHRSRVASLENMIVTFEEQQMKGRRMLAELKKAVDNEAILKDNALYSLDCAREKLAKYKGMTEALQQTGDELEAEILALQSSSAGSDEPLKTVTQDSNFDSEN